MAPIRARCALIVSLLFVVLMLGSGCSSGGGAASTGSGSAAGAGGSSSGQVTLTVRRDAAKSASAIPSDTVSIRVTVVGTNIVTTVPFPPGASEVQVVLEGVPLGAQVLLVEALGASGVIASGRLTVEVSASTVVEGAVLLTPVSPSPSPSVSPSPTPSGGSLVFSNQPPPRVAANLLIGDGAGGVGAVEVTVLDASGNVDTTATDPITLGLAPNPSSAHLSSLSLTVTPSNGKALFTNLIVTAPASGLAMLAKTSTLTSGPSSLFDCVSATLGLSSQPRQFQQAGKVILDTSSMPLRVSAIDAGGNVLTYVAGTCNALVSPNPGGATASGTSAAFSNGQATFAALQLSGSGAGYGFLFNASGLSLSSDTFLLSPAIADGSLFVGASDGNSKKIFAYDSQSFTETSIPVAYTPTCMVVTNLPTQGVTILLVGGDDNAVHLYDAANLQAGEVITAVGLPSVPKVMRQNTVTRRVYFTLTGSGELKYLDMSGYPTPALGVVAGTMPSVHGLAVDPLGTFYLDAFQNSTNVQIDTRLSATDAATMLTSVPGSATEAFLDFARSTSTGLMTFGSSPALPVTFDPVTATSPGGGYPGSSADLRFDVRFFHEVNGGSATALVANDSSGQIEVATVTPQTGGQPPAVTTVVNASDPHGLVNLSGAQYIALGIDPGGTVFRQAFVTDPSKNRLLLVDLTTTTPTIFAESVLPGSLSPTAITIHQAGFPNTH